MAIIDLVCYNGERELFEIRYNILKPFVDEFIVVSFDTSFSGVRKTEHFEGIDISPENYPNVKFIVHNKGAYEKYRELAESSPNTKGAEHWKTEFMQKESIKDCLTHLKDDDIVFIGDVDEIPYCDVAFNLPIKLKLQVYTYYLNNKSSEEFWGTIVAKYGDIKNECLNHIRTTTRKTENIAGWHFTSLHHQLERKLKDSYTEEDYANHEVLNGLQSNIENNRDFLGRSFTYAVNEEEWPEWLKRHRQDYLHLLK